MNWLVSVLIGHLLNALGFVLNKAALTVSIKNPGAFTFYVGALGLISLALAPLGFAMPQGEEWVPLALGGVFFMVAMLFFMIALSARETSRIAPFIGALVPVFTYLFEWLNFGAVLSNAMLIAFIVLIVGTVVVTIDLDAPKSKKHARTSWKEWLPWLYGIIAAAGFGISFVASREAYLVQPFWSAFIWMRVFSFVAVLGLLLLPTVRRAVWEARTIFVTRSGLIYFASQIVGAVAFIFINMALAEASASIVNALQGVQYAFLIILVLIGQIVAPKMVKEAMGKRTLAVRAVGVLIIGAGLALVAIQNGGM